LDRMELVNDHR
jgi:hypothetical protein